jgi:hypothetical protein
MEIIFWLICKFLIVTFDNSSSRICKRYDENDIVSLVSFGSSGNSQSSAGATYNICSSGIYGELAPILVQYPIAQSFCSKYFPVKCLTGGVKSRAPVMTMDPWQIKVLLQMLRFRRHGQSVKSNQERDSHDMLLYPTPKVCIPQLPICMKKLVWLPNDMHDHNSKFQFIEWSWKTSTQ